MISYELVKKLRDAGFPQEGRGDMTTYMNPGTFEGMDTCYIPILEEVIEALGDNFFSLHHEITSEPRFGKFYMATPVPPAIRIGGNTSLEAAINLYIAIHEKN